MRSMPVTEIEPKLIIIKGMEPHERKLATRSVSELPASKVLNNKKLTAARKSYSDLCVQVAPNEFGINKEGFDEESESRYSNIQPQNPRKLNINTRSVSSLPHVGRSLNKLFEDVATSNNEGKPSEKTESSPTLGMETQNTGAM